ncbi:MAG TPA: HAD hydrolase family protein [Armatimonadota bacterium]|nr:HAD hydrolase family protein [Armatimonadota bacterium]
MPVDSILSSEASLISHKQANAVQLLVCGVDGVLTNGTIGYTSNRCETHVFNVRDGLGIRLANWFELKIAWISGRVSNELSERAHYLDVPLYPGYSDKSVGIRTIAHEMGVPLEKIAFVGDDLNDLPAFDVVGLPITVANAPQEVKDKAACVTKARGGEGAVREIIEAILRGQGQWEAAVENYLQILRDPERVMRFPCTEE